MSRGRWVLAVAVTAALGAVGVSRSVGAAPFVGDRSPRVASWGRATVIPGLAALDAGGSARVAALSCGAWRTCSAGGQYRDAGARLQPFLVDEAGGVWRNAIEVPGIARLNGGGRAVVDAISCRSGSSCSAGGQYLDRAGHYQVFVIDKVGGVWRAAKELPGSPSLNSGGNAEIAALACGSPGNCSAGGQYRDRSGHYEAFVADEASGVWGTAREVPGTATLNPGGKAAINAVSCASPGNCSGGGYYEDAGHHVQAFVVNETNHVWTSAAEVPGSAALNAGGDAVVTSISCPASGDCSAVGYYAYDTGYGDYFPFVVNDLQGVWGQAIEPPGVDALNPTSVYELKLLTISCGSVGNCSAGGFDQEDDIAFVYYPVLVNESHGVWANVEYVPGSPALNQGLDASVVSVSCISSRRCALGGYFANYRDGLKGNETVQALVDGGVAGVWEHATEVPGSRNLNVGGYASVTGVSCVGGACSAGGIYTNHARHLDAFVETSSI